MNVNEVIKHPILTEKTYAQMAKNVYTFAVDKRTNKSEVKKVVEFIFDVKVEKVNISTVDKKAAKLGRYKGFKPGYKKAVVTLKEGSTIQIFPDDTISEPNAVEQEPKKKAKKAKSKELTEKEKEIEAKVLEKLKSKKSKADKVIEKAEDVVLEVEEKANEVIDKVETTIKDEVEKVVDKIKDKESEE